MLLLLLSFVVATAAFAQSSSGSLTGHVTDETGAALPGVSVTATNDATGFNRTVVTESDGTYRFGSLPPGTYTVVTDLSGFASVTTKNVQVNVATERTLNTQLRQAAVKEQITVTAEAPLVATSPSVGTVVSQQELENLPLNGRQFANLGSLAPGTSLSVNADPTKPGQLTIALNGGSGRNVNFLIDGGDNTDDTIGGALQNFNIEAVQEFKIQTMQYKAEYGRSSGGVLSVVTKTGTNDLQGSVYEFYRSKGLNSESFAEEQAGGKGDYRRDQYGASIGGPIVRDRAHFFATYEKTKRNTSYTVNTPLLPTFNGQTIGLPFEDQLATAKASTDLTPKQFLQVRYGYQKNTDKYGASPLTAPSSLGTTTNKYWSLLGGHTWQLANDRLNEFVVQRTDFKNLISADSQDPFIYFPSGAKSGQSPNTPQSTLQKKTQLKDDFSWSSQLFSVRNDWKVGVNYIDEPTLAGDFTIGTTGQFNLLEDKIGSPVGSILYNGGFSGVDTPIKQYNIYGQDDISINPRLTVNVGLRYDLWTGYDINQSLNPNLALVQQLADSGRYTESYIQDFKNGGGTQLSNDKNNWSPRLGFTYDLSGTAKNILRGGVGRYYDFPYTNATILFPASAVQSLFGPVYIYDDPKGIRNPNGTFFQPGQPLPPNQISGNLSDRTTRELASPTLRAPYSDQLSLGYSTQIADSLGLNFEVVSIRYKDIPFRFRANPIDPATGKRRFAPVAPTNFRIWYGKGHAEYDGVNLGFRSRIGSRFEAQGFYTLSRAEGNILAGADEFRVVDAGFQPDVLRDASVNPLDPDCDACNGPLDTDARHRVTLSTVYRAPLGINLSGILRWRSALPYTVFANGDPNGDGIAADLAPGHHVNDQRGASFSQVDLRVSKDFRFGGRYGLEGIAEVFNLFNSKNPAGFDRTGTANFHAGDPGQGDQRVIQLGLRARF
ncbi:MAG TPA: TonB-dependent receptor [Thermoanaerobaculia bacterium]|nr:TonB-dependent receptor [Thermoanaerobaculia bacterium]